MKERQGSMERDVGHACSSAVCSFEQYGRRALSLGAQNKSDPRLFANCFTILHHHGLCSLRLH